VIDWTPVKTSGFSPGNGPLQSEESGSAMAGQPGFFDSDERLKALSAAGGPLERLAQVIDFEVFRSDLEGALLRNRKVAFLPFKRWKHAGRFRIGSRAKVAPIILSAADDYFSAPGHKI
jgi:hypothetical protein